ncbi:DUF882 domain-containing protein, partial [Methylobrevis pamukkalensis]|uniref:DUF882 domain-containing protein n=1 Tax=Methylobrevis pamukkalensis TaxID=1439726 RepID=UPI000ABC63AE
MKQLIDFCRGASSWAGEFLARRTVGNSGRAGFGPTHDGCRSRVRIAAVVAATLLVAVTGVGPVQAADNRTLDLYNTHTRERLKITFKQNGRYVESGLRELNRFLRDWRRNESRKMDPRLFDTVWEVYRQSGSRKPIHVVSAYRSLATNDSLRSRSKGVAKHSQHTMGKAMDFYLPDVGVAKLRTIALKMQRGGIGYYPTSNNPFVHVDVGSVRHWPRMTRAQLAKVFPDGKTVHMPSDGRPMAGYEQALAELKRTQASSAPLSLRAEGEKKRPKGLLAMLFDSGEDDEEEMNAASGAGAEEAPAPVRVQQPARQELRNTPPKAVAAPAPVRVQPA